jgi:hypothetical protein
MKSRVKGDFKARFRENVGVKFPCVTRLYAIRALQNISLIINMDNVKKTIEILKRTFPDSSFDFVKEEWISSVERKYPDIPDSLKSLYRELGYGTIGDSYYSIHAFLEPTDIYDQETAERLKGKYIVGDDFCGDCHAYDAEDNWKFGFIDCNGEFNDLTDIYPDFIYFLYQLALNQVSNGE